MRSFAHFGSRANTGTYEPEAGPGTAAGAVEGAAAGGGAFSESVLLSNGNAIS